MEKKLLVSSREAQSHLMERIEFVWMNTRNKHCVCSLEKKKILDIEISLYFFSSAEIPLLSPSFSQPWPFCFHSYSPCCCAFNFGFHIKMCKWRHTKYLLAPNIYSTKWNEQTAHRNILALSIKRIAKSHTSFAICFQLLSFFFSGSECDQIKWENKIKTFISWAVLENMHRFHQRACSFKTCRDTVCQWCDYKRRKQFGMVHRISSVWYTALVKTSKRERRFSHSGTLYFLCSAIK